MTQFNEEIKINTWKLFPYSPYRSLENLEVSVNDRKRTFSRGKFFLFILLDKNTGLKILFRSKTRKKYRGKEELQKIIRIQKIFHKEQVGFDCDNEVLEVPIIDIASNKEKVFYGYITSTDINPDQTYNKKKIRCAMKKIKNILPEYGIHRPQMYAELKKFKNYIVTNSMEYMYIDFDPKFYFINKNDN